MGFLKGKVTRVDSQGCDVQLDAGTAVSLPLSGATLSVGSSVTLVAGNAVPVEAAQPALLRERVSALRGASR